MLPENDCGNDPGLKAGDSRRRQSCDCIPERVPASMRLPGRTIPGFHRKHSFPRGEFYGYKSTTSSRPSFAVSPQADTACPAAVSPVDTPKAEIRKFQLRSALYPPLKGEIYGAFRAFFAMKLRKCSGGRVSARPRRMSGKTTLFPRNDGSEIE